MPNWAAVNDEELGFVEGPIPPQQPRVLFVTPRRTPRPAARVVVLQPRVTAGTPLPPDYHAPRNPTVRLGPTLAPTVQVGPRHTVTPVLGRLLTVSVTITP